MALDVIVAILGLAFLLLYFCFQLEKDHFLLKLIFIFSFFTLAFLIPSAIINDDCEVVTANQTVSGSLTTYEYKEFCTGTTTSTEQSFHRTILFTFRIFVIYFFVYVFFHWYAKKSERFGEWLEKLKK